MFEPKLREGENVLCHLHCHGFFRVFLYLFALFETFVFFLIYFVNSAGVSGTELLPFIVYCLLYPSCQHVVFTNRRVICRGGMLLFKEKSFALPEIKLFKNPLLQLLLKTYCMLKISEDGRNFCFGGMAVNTHQSEFMRQKYKVSEQSDWFGLWWWR